MKIKQRIKNAGFWTSLISAVFLMLGAFGIEVADGTASAVINGVCSALVVLGIVSDPTSGKGYLDGDEEERSGTDVTGLISAVSGMMTAGGGRENEKQR